MASTTSSIVTIFCILAVGHLAQAEAAIAQDGARKLLQMDAMSPMMMAMAPAASMMNAMAPVPMMMNSMFNVSLTPTAEVPGTVSFFHQSPYYTFSSLYALRQKTYRARLSSDSA